MFERVQGEVSAIAPSPEAETAAIELRKLLQRLLHAVHLVAQFDRPEVVLDGQRERLAAIRHAAIVDMQHGESLARQNLVEQIAAHQASTMLCAPGPPYGFTISGALPLAIIGPPVGSTMTPCNVVVPSAALKSTNLGVSRL